MKSSTVSSRGKSATIPVSSAKFPQCGVQMGLAHLHPAAGKAPQTTIGRICAPYEKNLVVAQHGGEYGGNRSDGSAHEAFRAEFSG